MQSHLIQGGNEKERKEKLEELIGSFHIARPYSVTLNENGEEAGIDAVRVWKKRLILTPPTGLTIAGIIYSAGNLTVEAQNALLKILEEPPSFAHIFLETGNAASLIPTTISRVETYTVRTDKQSNVQSDDAVHLLSAIGRERAGDVLSDIDLVRGTRTELLSLIDTLMAEYTGQLTKKNGNTYANSDINYIPKILSILLLAKKYLSANTNIKLALENAILVVKTSSSMNG